MNVNWNLTFEGTDKNKHILMLEISGSKFVLEEPKFQKCKRGFE